MPAERPAPATAHAGHASKPALPGRATGGLEQQPRVWGRHGPPSSGCPPSGPSRRSGERGVILRPRSKGAGCHPFGESSHHFVGEARPLRGRGLAHSRAVHAPATRGLTCRRACISLIRPWCASAAYPAGMACGPRSPRRGCTRGTRGLGARGPLGLASTWP